MGESPKMLQHLSWKRFWCSRTGTMSLNDNGFFLDPESEYARYYHNGVATFEEILKIPCLILLGEAGFGKTTTLISEIKALQDRIADKEEVIFFKDLNEYGDENRLIREIFESSTVRSWLKGEQRLHLFLDSFDECLSLIPNLSAILLNKLGDYKNYVNRLSLRVSCRTGGWPEMLTDGFIATWGKENVGIYELTPLRRKDITEAASSFGLNASKFVASVEEKGVQPLASSPITLAFLLNEFKSKQQFSRTRSELFRRGCERLCIENNPGREFTERTDSLSPSRRLALACRIAAVMVFCNRTSILTKEDDSDSSDTNLLLSMFQEGYETTGYYTFNFTSRDLLETVKQTGLFSGRGPHRFGFVHQSYAEFLAAQYLSLHQLSIQQIKSLIQLSYDPDQMIIPQLKETTAWLNLIIPEMVRETIKTDPQSMLSGDIQSLESRLRRDLVESLLKQFEQQKISDADWDRYFQYQKLKHPELASQLKPYIKDKSKHFLVRRVAIDIAEACLIEELQGALVDVALDTSDDLHIRDQAAHAVSQIADDNSRLRLKSLALEIQPDDEYDQLKGSALSALWPKHLSAQEVLDSLTPRKKESFYGSYAQFLIEFPEQLKPEDLPAALRWAKSNPEEDGVDFRFENLTEKILFRAWHYLSLPDVLEGYADAVIPRLKDFRGICPAPQIGTEERTIPNLTEDTRKNLIKAVVSKINDFRNYLFISLMDGPQILSAEDLDWLIKELRIEKKEDKKRVWVEMVHEYYNVGRPDHTELVFEAMKEYQPLADKFKNIFEAVPLDSPRAQEMRDRYAEHQKWDKKRKQREAEQKKKITPSIYERIKTCLDRFENGDSNAWWQLCLEMTLEDTSKYYKSELNSDLISLPGWQVCDDDLRKRIVNACKKYVLENDASPSNWLGKNTYYRPAMAGYKALVLLKKKNPDFLDSLSTDIWSKWAPVIMGYPESVGIAGRDTTFLELIRQAYQKTPKEIIDSLYVLIDKDNSEHGNLFILRKIDGCLDDPLQNALLSKAKDISLKPGSFQDLLSILIKSGHSESNDYAKALLTDFLNGNDELRERAQAAALALIIQANDAGWDTVWPAIQLNTDFGKSLFLLLPDSLRHSSTKTLADRIGEEAAGALFIWLSKYFPRQEDTKEEGAHWVGPRESLANYRDGLLEFLKTKGSQEAIKAIEHIKQEIPDMDFLNFYLISARENLRRKSWIPLSPDDFLLLTRQSSSRLILNADHLLDALRESLLRLENKLQGETPNAIFLWDRTTNAKLKPKSEHDFTDFVKTHLVEDLKQSGTIALREVEIRRRQGEGGNPGERTDIYVSGFIPLKKEFVTVIIEVKGCWHLEVRTAMKTQLLDRYLNETSYNHGIYLVGWYSCNQWDKRGTKRNMISVPNIEEARQIFDDQAKALSTDQKTIKACVLNCALR